MPLPSKRSAPLLFATLLLAATVHAQPGRRAVPFDTSGPAVRLTPEQLQRIHLGSLFGAFEGKTVDGAAATERMLAGKVTLILFWYPSLGYSNRMYQADYLQIDTLAGLARQQRDFQIVSLLPDTADLALFRTQHPELSTFTVVNLQSHAKARELNRAYAMPSCILVDRSGKIAAISRLGKRWLDQREMTNKVRALLLQ